MKRPKWSPLVAGLLLTVPLATAPAQAATTNTSAARAASITMSTSYFETRLLARTNYRRTHHGCRALRLNAALVHAARLHSSRMAYQRDLSHRLAGEGDLAARAVAAGYLNWRILAENLAWGQATPRAVFRAWVASPAHRANLDNCALRDVGFGVVYAAGRPWVTADFGRHVVS